MATTFTQSSGMGAGDQARWDAHRKQRVPGQEGALGLLSSRQTRGPSGELTYSNEYGANPEDDYALREKYNTLAQNRMLSGLTVAQGGGTGAPTVSRDTGEIAAKEQAGRQAAFARAKEQSAATAQASLAGLRNNLARRGITGGGYAQMKGAEALAPAADRLQDFTREQLIQDVNNLQHTGDMDYQGQIQQRGQTLQNQQSMLGLLKSMGGLY